MAPPANPRLFSFVAGSTGAWTITETKTIVGQGLPSAEKLAIVSGARVLLPETDAVWTLRGITSNERYVTQAEKAELTAKQPPLGRAEADCAVLIPIRKNPEWWSLAADARRRIFEDQSHHTSMGIRHLPAIARRLHHCRDLGEDEPFDFLTWFEFSPADRPVFDRLLAELRATPEWAYVEREVEVRLTRTSA